MNRSRFLQTFLIGSIATMTPRNLDQNSLPTKDELTRIWEFSRELTIKFAEAMPANDYHFRPPSGSNMYTYGEQMHHIATNIAQLFSTYITDSPPPSLVLQTKDDKDAIIRHIHRSFDYGRTAIQKLSRTEFAECVPFFTSPIPRWHILFIAQDHTTHHCGQAVVYLNMKSITPPSYRKWPSSR